MKKISKLQFIFKKFNSQQKRKNEKNKIKVSQTSGGICFSTRTSFVDSRRRLNPGIPGTSSGKKSSTKNSGAAAISKPKLYKLLKKLLGKTNKPAKIKQKAVFSKNFFQPRGSNSIDVFFPKLTTTFKNFKHMRIFMSYEKPHRTSLNQNYDVPK